MARHRGVRRHLTRNRSIALVIAIGAFALVGITGVDLGLQLNEAQSYAGSNFNIRIFDSVIPLQTLSFGADKFGLECQAWTQGYIHFIDGTKRALQFNNNEFKFNLAVIDPLTNKQVNKIAGEIRARCTAPNGLGSLTGFTMTGGTVNHFFAFKKTDNGQTRNLADVGSQKTLGSNTNLLSTSSSGILLSTFEISATDINNAILTTSPDYIVELTLWTDVTLNAQGTINGQKVTASGQTTFASWSYPDQLKLKITGGASNVPPPPSNIITVKKVVNGQRPSVGPYIDLKNSIDAAKQEVAIDVELPQFSVNEPKPKYNIYNTDTQTGKAIGSSIKTGILPDAVTSELFRGFADVTGKVGGVSSVASTVYTVVASSDVRSGTDSEYFVVVGASQSGGTVPVCTGTTVCQTPPTGDVCEGKTGTDLQQCEIARGAALSCSKPTYVPTEIAFYKLVAAKAGVIVQLQPGSAKINEFTTHVCLAQQSIDLFNSLGGAQCTAPFVFVDSIAQCVCPFTNTPESQEKTCTGDGFTGELDLTPMILYEIVYAGANDIGSLRELDPISFTVQQLSLAGTLAEKANYYPLSRIHVAPVIDLTSVPAAVGNPHSPVFTYKWLGEVVRADKKEDLGLLEECIPANFGSDRARISPSTTCKLFDMNSVGITTDGTKLGLHVETDVSKLTKIYQIARTDVRPDQIEKLLTSKGITLESGEGFTLKLEIEGSFLLGSSGITLGVVSPMTWSKTFTWLDGLEEDVPCQGLTGERLNQCLGPVDKNDPRTNPCLPGETALQCWERNHPVTETDESGNNCRQVLALGKIETVCKGEPTSTDDTPFGSDPKDKAKGDPGSTLTGDCPAGSTATECADLFLKVLESRLAGLLGIGGDTITTLSNNAVLIIGAIIVILVIALVVKSAINRRRRRRGY